MSQLVQSEARFRQLLADGCLPASQCGRRFLGLCEPLFESGFLQWERTGAGRRLVVQDRSVLADFIAKRYPRSGPLLDEEFRRVEGVGRFRDSKALPNNAPEVILMRVFQDVLTHRGDPVPAAAATSRFGVFAMRIDPAFRLSGRCALVENPALFFSLERLHLDTPVAILSRGFASLRLVEWLEAQELSVLHLPDYDPVGLSEFLRLHQALGDRVSLHIPSDLPERFRRYSNPALLHPLRSSDMLRRVRASLNPSVVEVLERIDHFGAGLEQEALLLPL